ncbi:MAG: hypothetical protein JO044_03785 [Mycobacteriaceae bacterium]|nr:hypothetical protein [Mycobacteriaceae bacterium]MBV9640178.1 hypothetical protein [Mycobacteriaceae bacterium]
MRETVERSGLQYAAAACVIAGGMLAAGRSVVIAVADPGGMGQHDSGRSGLSGESGGAASDSKGGSVQGISAWRRGDGRPQRRPGQPPDGQSGEGSGGSKDPHDPCDHGGGGGGGGLGQPPPGSGGSSAPSHHGGQRPPPVIVPGPPLQPQPGPVEPDIGGATAGPAEASVPHTEPPVLTLPLVVPPPALEVGAGSSPRAPSTQGSPGAPPNNPSPANSERLKSSIEPVPAEVGRSVGLSESFRAGYSEYLRTAGVAEMAALAVPGVAGILLLTAGGGFIGYRQAKAGHVVRTEGIARFLQ